jgi:3-methylcrotonyl-CoA carboxylase alpha subunit
LPAFGLGATGVGESPWDLCNHWRMNLPSVEQQQLLHDDVCHQIHCERKPDGWQFGYADRVYRVNAGRIDDWRMWVDLDGERIHFAVLREAGRIALVCDGHSFVFELPAALLDGDKDLSAAGHPQAPMSGAVIAVSVSPGDQVAAGDTLMIIEAMKMEHSIVAQVAATVVEVLFTPGDQVDEGETLIMLEVE